MLNRARVINWWIGRLTDAELAFAAGMTTRNLQILLNVPIMKMAIVGGGRGSKLTRRIPAKARNAIGMVQALHSAGLTLDLSAQLIGSFWFLPSTINEAIDFSPFGAGVRSLLMLDPNGGFLPTDIVPAHIVERFVLPCGKGGDPNPSEGDVVFVPADQLGDNWAGLENSGLVPLTKGVVYQGEIDPLGLWLQTNTRPETMGWDTFLQIVNGRWVFCIYPEPSGVEVMNAILRGEFGLSRTITRKTELLGEIIDGGKVVRSLRTAGEQEKQRADYERRNFDSAIDVNLTLPVRRMKRRALGLGVDGSATETVRWSELPTTSLPP